MFVLVLIIGEVFHFLALFVSYGYVLSSLLSYPTVAMYWGYASENY